MEDCKKKDHIAYVAERFLVSNTNIFLCLMVNYTWQVPLYWLLIVTEILVMVKVHLPAITQFLTVKPTSVQYVVGLLFVHQAAPIAGRFQTFLRYCALTLWVLLLRRLCSCPTLRGFPTVVQYAGCFIQSVIPLKVLAIYPQNFTWLFRNDGCLLFRSLIASVPFKCFYY